MKFHHIGIIIAKKSQVEDFCRAFKDKIVQEQYVKRYSCYCYFLKKSKIEFVLPSDKAPSNLKGFNRGYGGIHHIALEVKKDEIKELVSLLTEKRFIRTKLFKINFLHSIIFNFPIEFILNKGGKINK